MVAKEGIQKLIIKDLWKKLNALDKKLISLIFKRAELDAEIKFMSSNENTSEEDKKHLWKQMLAQRSIDNFVKQQLQNKEYDIDAESIQAIWENLEWLSSEIVNYQRFKD